VLRDKGLQALLATMKGDNLSKESPANTLKKAIDDYCKSGKFDEYMKLHSTRLAFFARDQEKNRRGTFRASGAGRCPQEQAFSAIEKHYPNSLVKDVVVRPPHNSRALHNGTFMHLRYHMLFDALHDAGIVETLYSEELRFNRELDLSGTIDRVVRFQYDGKPIVVVVDFKSVKSKYYSELVGPKIDHAYQQHAYRYFGYSADRWLMLYENKDTHEIKLYDRPYESRIMETLKNNYELLTLFVDAYIRNKEFAFAINVQREDETIAHFPEELPKLPLIVKWCNWCDWQTECLKLNPERVNIKVDYNAE